MTSPSTDLEKNLLSSEKMDRSSPDLWPEQIPGVSHFVSTHSEETKQLQQQPAWLKDLDKTDINLLQEYASLSPANLVEEVKGLQNLAYQLGLDEAREMTRGKFLNILDKDAKKKK